MVRAVEPGENGRGEEGTQVASKGLKEIVRHRFGPELVTGLSEKTKLICSEGENVSRA